MINRREFLKNASVLTGAGALTAWGILPYGCSCSANANFPAYENKLRDRLWMWGHDSGVYDGPNGVYNIPLSPSISMADGIKYMGIPNVCVIRHGIPDDDYLTQFKEVKRIAWTLSMGSNESYHTLKDYVFKLRDRMPNLTGYFLDDFFRLSAKSLADSNSAGPAPAALSMEEMKQLYDETLAYKRRLDLSIVLYTHQLHPSIQPVMKYVDVVSLWIWTGADIQMIEDNFKKYRSLVPDKPTLLGIYMWDFGGKKELSQDFMVKQLDYAHQLYQEGQIEGLIFHCTPLVNKNLQAVEYAKEWIAKHGDEKR
ncbi:MAG: twin-arginine translocation signal domain-containing protein [Bacteroidales bacterium]|nr:twin-arginine translocation signal domain-containing protein [Bacteroidales bacterium]